MAISTVEYRHEYVSGVVTLVSPAMIFVRVANRGGKDGVARVIVHAGDGVLLDSGEVPGVVEPGGIWFFDEPLSPTGIDHPNAVSYWAQIQTTSPDLVPCLSFQETVYVEGVPQRMRESAYFAPGDFAMFPLHPSPFHPLPGPVQAAQ